MATFVLTEAVRLSAWRLYLKEWLSMRKPISFRINGDGILVGLICGVPRVADFMVYFAVA